MTERRCKNCEYFCGDDQYPNSGECRLNPPRIYSEKSEYQYFGEFPNIYADSWCRFFKQKQSNLRMVKCSDCEFSECDDIGDADCHYYPPKFKFEQPVLVRRDWWCGKRKKRKEND